MELPLYLYEDILRRALAEDIGTGDITTTLCVPAGVPARGMLLAKSAGVIAGLGVAAATFRLLDPDAIFESIVQDGAVVTGDVTAIAHVSGDARALLSAERVALNFIQRMSGVATITSRLVALTAGSKARIVDTRKTTPGLRVLEKYSVRVGGGLNHRFGLYDSILVKDNHIRVAGGVRAAVLAARAQAPHTMRVEVEVTCPEEIDEGLEARADTLLLDNMSVDELRIAIQRIGGRAVTEASGGMSEATVAAVAATGVDIISVGALTHSAPAMDISLDFTV
ncbi:MAG: carboxylating nicotinate-nucleotide diphosphorylase [Capsulimonadaceae bacterium]